jgi:hypothetical protein
MPKSLDKSPLERLRRTLNDNVKMDVKEVEWNMDGAA